MAECSKAKGSRRLRLIMGTGAAKLAGALCFWAKALMQEGRLEEITSGQRFQGPLALYPVPSDSHYWQPIWMAERNLSCKTWEDCCAIMINLVCCVLRWTFGDQLDNPDPGVWMPSVKPGLEQGMCGWGGSLILQCWTWLLVRKLIEFITFFKDEGKNRNHEWNPTQHHK